MRKNQQELAEKAVLSAKIDKNSDRRNLVDELKGMPNEKVFAQLEKRRLPLEIAIYNVEHDFNAGTIVRSANNFNVRKVWILGRRKYNRRGAMCTDKYLKIEHAPEFLEWAEAQKQLGKKLVAIENNTPRAVGLQTEKLPEDAVLIFGSEGSGIAPELLAVSDEVRMIEGFGSTRSLNVGVAAGIAMYEWVRQHVI